MITASAARVLKLYWTYGLWHESGKITISPAASQAQTLQGQQQQHDQDS
jgi:hypothetical protein